MPTLMKKVLIPSSSGHLFRLGTYGSSESLQGGLNPFFIRSFVPAFSLSTTLNTAARVLIPSSSGHLFRRGSQRVYRQEIRWVLIPSSSGHLFRLERRFAFDSDLNGLNPFFIRSFVPASMPVTVSSFFAKS